MAKSGRLVSLMFRLQQKDFLTAHQLAGEFEVHERTIYRNIDQLITEGVPIEALAGPGGGYRLPMDYHIGSLTLSREQVSFMGTATVALRGLVDFLSDFNDIDRVYTRILRDIPPRERGIAEKNAKCFYFDRSRWYVKYTPSDLLRTLKTSVLADRCVAIRFRPSDDPADQQREDHVDPYGLVYKSDTWYLVGHSRAEQKVRRWNVHRVASVQVQDGQFARPADFLLEAWWKSELEHFGQGPNRVLLAIERRVWYRFERLEWKQTNRFQVTDDAVLVELFVDSDGWIVDLVVVNRGTVKVLEPIDLRDRVVDAARRIAESQNTPYPKQYRAGEFVHYEALSLRSHDG
jgi:predicted DNA-binding transcriptional regulator YafY